MTTKYPDECGHGKASFFGTVRLHGTEGDLYFYRNFTGIDNRWHYCFRHGNMGEYYSAPMEYQLRTRGHSSTATASEVAASNNDTLSLIAYCLEFRGITL